MIFDTKSYAIKPKYLAVEATTLVGGVLTEDATIHILWLFYDVVLIRALRLGFLLSVVISTKN